MNWFVFKIMQITSVDGMRVYVPEAKDFNMEVKPSYLLIASQTWKEGASSGCKTVFEADPLAISMRNTGIPELKWNWRKACQKGSTKE